MIDDNSLVQDCEAFIVLHNKLCDSFKEMESLAKVNHKDYEEKMQILLHSLQNKGYPKSTRAYVKELTKVRNLRHYWCVLAMNSPANQQQTLYQRCKNIVIQIKTPKVRVTALTEYEQLVNNL